MTLLVKPNLLRSQSAAPSIRSGDANGMSLIKPVATSGPGGPHLRVRKMAAIVFADVAGYSRLMQTDEDDTHRRLMQLKAQLIEPQVGANRGRVVKQMGDGFLAVFDTPQDAANFSVNLQSLVGEASRSESPGQRINFRMGVHAAEIIFEDDDVFGDGVNIAARLQNYAEPGGVVISDAVAKEIQRDTAVELADLGHLPLRNIAHPVRAFSLRSVVAGTPPLGEVLPGSEGPPSIVVLPFRDENLQDGEEYFAEGIVDDIVHALSGLKELFVIARGSTLGYRARAFDVRQIGRDLGVRYVLHGRVQRTSNAIRIRLELCNAESGEIVFSDRYDGELTDLFALQRQIASRVVMILAPRVRERERLRAMRKNPQNMTAYDLVLQALGPLFAMDYDSFSLAHGLLKRAIAHDTHYGPAYSYAAYWHLLRVGQGWSNDPALEAEEAARMAETAIRLDENDALALAICGHVHSYLKKDYETAVEQQERAIEVGPSCAMAWTLSSVTRGFLGHGPIAVARAERGLQLSPAGPHVVYHEHILAQAHYVNGDYEAAVQWGRRAWRHNERLLSNARCFIASLVAAGLMDEARQVAQRLMQFDPAMNLTDFTKRTPLRGALRDGFVDQLRAAGIPD
jgi:TolB-like protein/class 3 adenylate cyclase